MQIREQTKSKCLSFDGQMLVSAGFSHNILGWNTVDNRPCFSINTRQSTHFSWGFLPFYSIMI